MNTLPPGVVTPLRKKRASRYKKPLRFLDRASQLCKLCFMSQGSQNPFLQLRRLEMPQSFFFLHGSDKVGMHTGNYLSTFQVISIVR